MLLRSAVIVLSALCGALLAQEGSGRLNGTVTDNSDALVPGVTVSVLHKGTGLTRQTVTDAAGNYLIPALPIGVYDVTASRDGFAVLRSTGVAITVGSVTRLDQPIQSLRRNDALDLRTGGKAESKKLPFLRSCHRTLRLIHLELELLRDESREALITR
jgi:hypothetical protein